MKDLAFDLAPPLEPVEQPATLLAAGPATSDVGQVTVQGYNEAKPSGVRVGRAGISPEQSAKAGGLDRPLVALLDTLAGALQGATAQTLGLPGDIRSILDLISKEGATKYLGEPVLPTTERMQEILPAVVPQGVANQADREQTAKMASNIGTFLPAPGIPEAAVQGAKMVGKAIKATKGLPVGMSIQAVGEGVDQLGFYSAAKQAVDAIQQPKGTGDQFLKQIEKTPGVKPDEIKWTGLDEFLKSKKSVTKAEVQEYLDKNRVEVKEITLNEGARPYRYVTADEWQGAINDAERVGNFDEAERITAAWEDFELGAGGNKPKFAKYTLPGGENYREVLLTLPPKQTGQSQIAFKTTEDADNFLTDMSISGFEDMNYGRLNDTNVVEFDGAIPSNVTQMIRNNDGDIIAGKEMAGSTYGSSHFEQPNILAHLRVNDRIDADGKKVLFVEEVQSDWHQAGRKKGYASADKPYEVFDPKDGKPIATFATEKEAKAYADELGPQVDYAKSEGVPDAPFKTTWSELAMKRAIQMASEGGYERIAFTTGKTQAERFDLSKEISDLTITRNKTDFSISAVDQNGNPVIGRTIPDLRNLDEYVGKDLAEKVKDDFANKSGNEHVYSGLDLQVGGEGMKGFYDDILPKFLNKYAKKWDAKAGMTNIITNDEIEIIKANAAKAFGKDSDSYKQAVKNAMEEVHYIDITPKMRESVVTKGQPMFAIGAGGAGAAATQQEDNK